MIRRRSSSLAKIHAMAVPRARAQKLILGACLCLFFSKAAGAAITLQNHCPYPTAIFHELSPLVSQPDQPSPIDLKPKAVTSFLVPPGVSSISFWACKSVDKSCNAGNNSATVAVFSMGDETNSYQVSAKSGYNLPLSIGAPGPNPAMCPTITCTAKLADCPTGLRVIDSIGNINACESPPDSGENTTLYSSMFKDSDCLKEEPSTCAAGVYSTLTLCAT